MKHYIICYLHSQFQIPTSSCLMYNFSIASLIMFQYCNYFKIISTMLFKSQTKWIILHCFSIKINSTKLIYLFWLVALKKTINWRKIYVCLGFRKPKENVAIKHFSLVHRRDGVARQENALNSKEWQSLKRKFHLSQSIREWGDHDKSKNKSH